MTLDEAILYAEEVLHAEEVAKENLKSYKEWLACKNRGNAEWSKFDIESVDKSIEQCQKCAAEYRQLAEWLKDYKRLKEQEPCEDAISRQAVIERLKKEDKILYTTTGLNYLIRAIEELPSVNPQAESEEQWN